MSLTEDKAIEKEQKVSATTEEKFDGDIDLSVIRKKRFRIDGDNNKWIELNVSDMNILSRLTEAYPKLEKLQTKATKISEDIAGDSDDLDEVKLGKDLKSIDKDMRKIIDDIFDSNVSEVCAGNGSMFDTFGGVCRYEHIIDALIPLYENNISSEAEAVKAISKNIEKHTDKYSNKEGK